MKKTYDATASLNIVNRRLKEGDVPTEFQADGVVKKVFTYDTHEPIESPDIYVQDGGIYVSTGFYKDVMQKFSRICEINVAEARMVLYFTIRYTLELA